VKEDTPGRTDIDILGDMAADAAFPQDWTTKMSLMDPDMVLQNLLDAYVTMEQCRT
jgi:hypothetical protein